MPRQADRERKRDVFSAAALQVIMRAGLDGLTVREVAREAGFTTGALTHYFDSKDQLLIAASEYAAELMRGHMDKVALAPSARRALRDLIYSALPATATMRGRWRFWVAFWERASYSADVAGVMRERYREWTARVTSLIRRAQQQGEAPPQLDAERAGRELVALVDGIGVQVLLGVRGLSAPSQRQYIDSLLELRLGSAPENGVAARAPPAAPKRRPTT